MKELENLSIYPGGELVSKGLADLDVHTRSEEALLISAAAPILRFLGFEVTPLPGVSGSYEHALFEAIENRNPAGAHAEYNALLQRVFSFTQSFPRRSKTD